MIKREVNNLMIVVVNDESIKSLTQNVILFFKHNQILKNKMKAIIDFNQYNDSFKENIFIDFFLILQEYTLELEIVCKKNQIEKIRNILEKTKRKK